MMTTIEAAQAANVPVFSIRYTQTKRGKLTARNHYGIRVMDRVAKETGGSQFDARELDPRTYLTEIAEELRSSYELAYYPSQPLKDGSFHKIQIRPRLDNLTIRVKTGYFSR
jgi:Ca-activated chloride channel family protein